MKMRLYVQRMLAVILTAALLVGFLPEKAYALSFFEREYLTRISITGLTAPVAGAHPDYEIGCPYEDIFRVNKESSAGYDDGIAWYDLETGKYLTKDSVFEEGHAYKFYVHLRCSGDYRYFIRGCEVLLDEEEIYSNTWDNPTFMTASKTFERLPVKTMLTQVEISGDIAKGTHLTRNSPLGSETDGVASVEAVWTRNAVTLKGDTDVTFGKYDADLTIKAEQGYYFTWNTTVKVFGKERRVQSLSADGTQIHTTTSYREIACDHEGNTSGTWEYSSDKYGTALTHYKNCSQCGERIEEQEHTFDAGSVNGNQTTYTCAGCGYQKTVENGNKAITSLTVKDTPAFVGETIPVNQKPALKGLGAVMAEVTDVSWYEEENATPISGSGAKFEGGKTYKMVLGIQAKDGYYAADQSLPVFSNTCANDGSVNTGLALISNLSNDKMRFQATFTYKATKPVAVDFGLPTLKCGMTYREIADSVSANAIERADGTTASLNSNVTVCIVEGGNLAAAVYHKKGSPDIWSKLADGTDATELLNEKMVQPETEYKVEIVVDRETDYQYVDKERITTSGGSAETTLITGTNLLFFATVNANYTTGKAIVDTIRISDMAQPAIGQMPGTDYSLNGCGLLKVGTLSWNTEEPFTCGTQYKATATVRLAQSFAFAEDVSADWTGQFSLESITLNEERTEAALVFAAPVLEHEYGEWTLTTAPTCTEPGEEMAVCAHNESHNKTRIVDPAGHEYGQFTVTKPATCTEPGEEVAVCAKDSSHRYVKVINTSGHSFGQTFSSDAQKHWKACSACGEKTEEAVHTFDEGTVTKAATQTQEGIKTFTCTVCGRQKTETIPAVPGTGTGQDQTQPGTDSGTGTGQGTTQPGTGTGQDQTQPGTDTGTESGTESDTDSPVKKSQTMTVKTVKKTVKSSKLKKKQQVVSGAIKVSKSKGKVTYKKVKKGSSANLTIAKGTGRITVKKGTKKGTYKIKVTVTAAGNSVYKAKSKTVTVKIKVE